ncbi:MAG: hypothetical protein IAG13_08610, partial [Deltaproteobacteria bacterium]|nr:hypothetical protein [Nannocystaceae bacterium]
MPDNATDSNTQRPTDLDAGWGELLGDADGVPELVPTDTSEAVALPPEPDDRDVLGEPALPKRSVNAMLDQMARMLDVGEGTGPVVDLRRVLAPELEPSPAEVREPARASEASGASERTLITRRLRDDAPLLLELGDDAPRAVDEADDAPRLLTLTDAIPQPIEVGEESWPRRETKPLIVRPGDSTSLRASGEPAAARSGPAPVVPAKRSQWPWLAAAAV